jgi:beta-mannanase
MVTWNPTPAYADQIISGQADSCIRSFGNAIANQSAKVLVRPYWEFNGDWMPFSKNSNGTRASADQERQLWQHTIDVLRTTNFFTKASVVWSPGEGHYNNGDAWNNPTPYPGDTYVDWVASDSYNFDSSGSWCGFHAGWCTFAESFTHGYVAPTYTPRGVEHDFRGRKPYLVAETGSLEDPNSSGRKGQWMIDMGNYAKTYMPDLYAIVYFDMPYNGKNWNLDTSTSSMNGFKSFANDPYFRIPTR